MQNHFLIALFLLLTSFSIQAQPQADSLARFIQNTISQDQLAGIGLSILSADEMYFQEAFGWGDVQSEEVFRLDHIQNIGSISKTFIGIALMKAVELGHLDLDHPINQYLPFQVIHPRFPQQAITVRHLANHSSGILDRKAYEKSYVLESELTEEEMAALGKRAKEVKKMANHSALSLEAYLQAYLIPEGDLYKKNHFSKVAPGVEYQYSNVGAGLAALVLAYATGESFSAFTHTHIFDPLEMTSTGWTFAEIELSRHAEIYFPGQLPLPRYHLNTYPDGGLLTTHTDLAQYFQELMRGYQGKGKLLTAASYQAMMKPQIPTRKAKEGERVGQYGIFWETTRSGSLGHNGADPGIMTIMYFNPETGVGKLLTTNMSVYEDKKTMTGVRSIWGRAGEWEKGL